jgi:hypothetical protein
VNDQDPLYTNKETLLPFLRLHPRPLEYWIRTANPNMLGRRRGNEVHDGRFAELRARSFQRVADNEEDGAAHEKRWFPDVKMSYR